MISKKLLSMLIFSALVCAAPLFAAQEAPAPASEAKALLMRMGEFLSQAKQFSVNIRSGYDVVQESGQKIEFGESRKVTLARPDHIRVESERSDGEKVLVIFDGKEITVFSPKEKVFAKAEKPGDVDGAVLYLLKDLGVRLPLAMMFVTKLPSELERRVKEVDLVEQSTIMDVPCSHLAVRGEEVDFQVWVPSQGDPLPRRVVITYKNAPGQPQYWANLSDWNLSPSTPEGFFSYTPTEGVLKIPFLSELEVAKPEVTKVKKGGKK